MAILTQHGPRQFREERILKPNEVTTVGLLLSDVHFDSTKCDRDMLKDHLDKALALKASVYIFGDWFDLMQGMYDPRRSYSSLRPEYKSITYLDDVINDAVEFLEPYKEVLAMVGRGNHETNIEKRLSTSPIDRLVGALGGGIMAGPYSGWVQLVYSRNANNHGGRHQRMLHFHHGYGGNAPRSKGVLNVDLDQKEWPDADVIVSGHTHQKWHVPMSVERITDRLNTYEDTVHHLKLGSYKKLDRFAGWEVEKGFQQPRLGGWWMDAELRRTKHDGVDVARPYLSFREAT
jgi:UDP-2,3-diacylglucosamine pyrophosphatase LpxH